MTDGLVAAAFDHRTSRAGDPLLHTHVVTANLTLTVEGRWQAIDGTPLFDHAHPSGYLYQAHLRHVLSRDAGVEWTPVVNGWAEVVGVPEDVIRAFSKRRDEIEEVVAEAGYTSARAHQVATLATRKAKDYGVSPETLFDRWRAEAAALGFDGASVDACFGRDRCPAHDDDVVERLFDRLAGTDGLTERASTFDRRVVIEALAESLGAAVDADTIGRLADRFCASARVVVLDGAARGRRSDRVVGPDGRLTRTPGTVRYSTPELLSTEARLLAWAADGFGSPAPQAAPVAVADALAARPELSPEQVAMVTAVCGAHEAIQPVAGRPGAGKTYATDACVDALVASGLAVVGCAVSATAAAELEAATELEARTGRPASTIARLLMELDDPKVGGFAPRTILILDEASMAGTRDLARLAAHLARTGGAMKLIGDPDQHGPVDTGGLFRKLVAERGDEVVSLIDNNRQTDDDERAAVDEYRQGRVSDALSRYDTAGKVVTSPTVRASYDAMVADWYEHHRDGGADPMIAGSNAMRRALNTRARARLKADGQLSGAGVVVAGREFLVGDWVVARRNDRRLTGPNRRGFVKNGSVGVVVDVDPARAELTIEFRLEGRIHLPRSYLAAGWLEHAYARTSYGVQGATLERGLYHPSDASSFEEGYVALTRGRNGTKLYAVEGDLDSDDVDEGHDAHEADTVGLDTIAAALERRRAKTLASDADEHAAVRQAAFAGWDLASLRRERIRLQDLLADVPAPVDKALAGAQRHRDALIARRRLVAEQLAGVEADPACNEPQLGQGAARLQATRARSHRLRRDLEGLEDALGRMDARVATLARRKRARDAYLAQHAEEVERLALLQRAEVARDVQVRGLAGAEALSHEGHAGSDPVVSARTRHTQRSAAEEVALYGERFGVPHSAGATLVEDLLGPRPENPEAIRAYDRAAGAIARSLAETTAEAAAPKPPAASLEL